MELKKEVIVRLSQNRVFLYCFSLLVYMFLSVIQISFSYTVLACLNDILKAKVLIVLITINLLVSLFLLILSGECRKVMHSYTTRRINKIIALLIIKSMLIFLITDFIGVSVFYHMPSLKYGLVSGIINIGIATYIIKLLRKPILYSCWKIIILKEQ